MPSVRPYFRRPAAGKDVQMRIAASEFILFCGDPAENAKKLSSIVPEVELMLDGDAWDHDENGWGRQAAALKELHIPFSIHPPAWDVNVAAPLAALREAAAFLNRKAVELCVELNASQIVYHPGYYDSSSRFSKNRAIDFSYQQLEQLIAAAKPHGITIAFENIGGPASSLFSQSEFIHALDGIDDSVQFLLDLGHANVNAWDIPHTIDSLAGRLCALHIHDNDGTGDSHLPIGTGTICWPDVFSAMKQLPESCLYIMEYQAGTPLEYLSAGRDMLQNALFQAKTQI